MKVVGLPNASFHVDTTGGHDDDDDSDMVVIAAVVDTDVEIGTVEVIVDVVTAVVIASVDGNSIFSGFILDDVVFCLETLSLFSKRNYIPWKSSLTVRSLA